METSATDPGSARLVRAGLLAARLPGAARASIGLLAVVAAALAATGFLRSVTDRRDAGRPVPHAPAQVADPRPCNVLLITSDTTRLDDLGCYGGPALTPNLADLAGESVRLRSLFTVALGTTPSHASLMTSLPARRHGVYDNHTVLGDEYVTLAEVLHDAGYRTAAFVGARPVSGRLGFKQGFERYEDRFGHDPSLGEFNRHERRSDSTTTLLLRWLGEHDERPFFAWLHAFDPHQPYCPPGNWLARGGAPPADEAGLERFFSDALGRPRYLKTEAVRAERPELLEAVGRAARRHYRGELAFVDAQVGRTLDALRAAGLLDRTLILFVSDHGENFLEDGADVAFDHGTLRAPVVRLAGLLKLPDSALAGITSGLLAASLDLAPTILDALGLGAPPEWQGRSLLPALRGTGNTRLRRYIVIEGAHRLLISVRTLRWALIRPTDPGVLTAGEARRHRFEPRRNLALYDLARDPGETVNLYDQRPEVVDALWSLAKRALGTSAAPPAATLDDPDHLEGLRVLGYVD